MRRVLSVALFLVLGPGIAAAQQGGPQPKAAPNDSQSRQARKGESCLKFHTDCGMWCEANQSDVANQTNCKRQCDGYQSTCLQTGVWNMPLARAEVRGLPAK